MNKDKKGSTLEEIENDMIHFQQNPSGLLWLKRCMSVSANLRILASCRLSRLKENICSIKEIYFVFNSHRKVKPSILCR